VAPCAEHFDGGMVDGINENNTIVNRQSLMNIHLNARQKGIRYTD
jgi:beta-glucosidase